MSTDKKEKRILPSRKYSKRSQLGEFWHRYSQNKGAVIALFVVLAIGLLAALADVIYDYDTQIIGYDLTQKLIRPCAEHPFGTDELGRDMLTRVLYGAKYSFMIGLSCAALCFVVGMPIGALAGYYGGTFDLLVMRIFDIIGSIPSLLIGIMVVAALGHKTGILIIALAIPGVGSIASASRMAVMTIRSSEYIESARAIGMKSFPLVMKHVVPNALNLIVVRVTLQVGSAIISASSLSYLGLGVPLPTPEWGALLSGGRKLIRTHSYLTLFPGLAIMITVLALNLMGDGLRDALDPKLKK